MDTVRPGSGPGTLRDCAAFFFRHASPRILAVALAAAAGTRLAVGGFSAWDLVPVLLVAAYWPLNEWLIHVFVLHAKPIRIGSRSFDPSVPRKHREHHRDPWNLEILFIPLGSFVYTLPLLVGLAFLLAPSRELALSGLVAYLALALHYEWVHFLAHTRYVPKTAHYRNLVRNHRLHHFKNERYWYGVSMLGADRPLGTAPAPEAVERSPTARTLGFPAA
jgi:sterol desaturase/sphingolipid hydroxylase (fatty acid hydroxylase superfamily)